jgi:hypothetical protein
MPTLKVNIEANGQPLRRAYVEHLVLGVGGTMYMTDDSGRVRSEQGDVGIASFTAHADIRILCQNSVAKVLDGGTIGIPLAVNQDKTVRDGDTVDLNTAAEQDDHYEILDRCLVAYDVVLRQFRPFSNLNRRAFPLKRQPGLRETKDQRRRIEISFPSQFPVGSLAIVEPKSLATGFPLVHFRARASDGRLLGENGQRPTLVPRELAHALHWSLFSETSRETIQNDYIGWIVTDIANGGPGTHDMGTRTTPMVAFLEALDHFAARFSEFVRVRVQGAAANATRLRPQEITPAIRRDFVATELSGAPLEGVSVATIAPIALDVSGLAPPRNVSLPGSIRLPALSTFGTVVPNPSFNGSDDEGSVYGCIFVDFARRVGLRTAVNAYLQSASAGVVTFGGYRTFIADTRPQDLPALEAAQLTWGL